MIKNLLMGMLAIAAISKSNAQENLLTVSLSGTSPEVLRLQKTDA
jgi:endonuclease V-like protein UPF0215 family